MTGFLLAAAFALIIGGAILFTNAIEWSGNRLDLGEGAVGSLLAAVGTALPESLIPVVAVLAGGESEQVAIGAIVGAPFMLATVAMLLVGASALAFRRRRSSGSEVTPDDRSLRRDLGLFLPCFAIGIGLGLIDSTSLHIAGAVGLLIAYGAYARQTVRTHSGESEDPDELTPLTFDPSKEDPPRTIAIVAQLVVGLLMIVGGAELFVEEVVTIAEALGVSVLVLSLVLAPLATELPEKLNSVLWMSRDKDTLAVGNITGAMAFQSTVPIAFGLAVTDWDLDRFAVAAGVAGLAGGALALWRLPKDRLGIPVVAAWSALFAGFVAFAALGS
jgi:cation:H+ antiporter